MSVRATGIVATRPVIPLFHGYLLPVTLGRSQWLPTPATWLASLDETLSAYLIDGFVSTPSYACCDDFDSSFNFGGTGLGELDVNGRDPWEVMSRSDQSDLGLSEGVVVVKCVQVG